MCDTVIIVDKDGVRFAKNSDRDANEVQVIEWHGRQRHAPGTKVRCTWIEIPQAADTHATLISRPEWMWGAEMGGNEHGVVIGNEAVFTKAPYAKIGLTGMDLVRLALERATTAAQACEVITKLIEEHGQGGGCGFENRRFTYHNSFMAADPGGAFVLETAGRAWVVEEVKGVRAISNGLTIPGFAERHSDFLYTRISACRRRRARTESLARISGGVRDLFRLLRDHGAGCAAPRYRFLNGGMGAICMHAGGVLASAQTTASWVSELRPIGSRHWVTGTAAPCTGLFKPVYVDQPLDWTSLAGGSSSAGLWRRHETLHRKVMTNPAELMPLFAPERDAVETAWVERPPEPRDAWTEASRLLFQWARAALNHTAKDVRPLWVRRYWAKHLGEVGAEMERGRRRGAQG
jgi:hypothetical protein